MNEYPPVLTKRDFVRRYSAREFGNASPTFQTIDALNCQGSSFGKYHLRNRVAGGATYYDLDWFQAIHRWRSMAKMEDWYVSEMAPTELTLLNGEVMQSEQGLQLYYSTVRKPMRDSLCEGGQQVCGILSNSILRHYMNPLSYDWLQVLLDRYPLHVIEISVYDKEWGTLSGYNSVFWEIRSY